MVEVVLEVAELSFDELPESLVELLEEPLELNESFTPPFALPPSGGVGAALPETDCPPCVDEPFVAASESPDEVESLDAPSPFCWP